MLKTRNILTMIDDRSCLSLDIKHFCSVVCDSAPLDSLCCLYLYFLLHFWRMCEHMNVSVYKGFRWNE